MTQSVHKHTCVHAHVCVHEPCCIDLVQVVFENDGLQR